jgi:N-acetylglucosamine kinase-like BadF-type ATPase
VASLGASALAVDGGQTGIKVRAVGGAPFARTFPGVRTNAAVLPQLADAVLSAAREAGPFATIAVGTTGLTEAEDDPGRLLALCAAAGVRRVQLAHDSITSYLGALGAERGVVVASGTGVVTLAVGAGRMARVDGWGHIMGDAGSGYWIGREALDAVMRAHDGRGPATALSQVVTARFPRLDQAYIELQTDPDQVAVVGSFAVAVSELATSDGVAAAICRRAGEELALSASAAARAVGLERPAVCLVGAVFGSDAVRSACLDALERRVPGFRPVPARGEGIDGAEALLTLPAGHPLASEVSVAG